MAKWISNKCISNPLIWLAYKTLPPINEPTSCSVTVISIMCLIIFKVKTTDFFSFPPFPGLMRRRDEVLRRSTFERNWKGTDRLATFGVPANVPWEQSENFSGRNIAPVVIYSFAFHFQVKFQQANLRSSLKMVVQTSQDDWCIQWEGCWGRDWIGLKCHQKVGLIALCSIVLQWFLAQQQSGANFGLKSVDLHWQQDIFPFSPIRFRPRLAFCSACPKLESWYDLKWQLKWWLAFSYSTFHGAFVQMCTQCVNYLWILKTFPFSFESFTEPMHCMYSFSISNLMRMRCFFINNKYFETISDSFQG